MKKILIILPYFGKFPNYFQLFLNSCGINTSINWQLITDQCVDDLIIPNNIFVDKDDFGEVKSRIKSIFESDIDTPYSLCKYKVVYPEIFSTRIKDYDFWGFCDCDLIFGNLREWITDAVLAEYDKISWRGHLTLFRNTSEINNLYKLEIPGYKTFKGCVFNSDGINLFDEVGINKIFDHEGKRIYMDLPLCDLRIRDYNFICQHNIFDESTNVNQIFEWSRNGLQRVFVANGKLGKQDVAYVHFLKRPMQISCQDVMHAEKFLIVPNRFTTYKNVSVNDVIEFSKNRFYWSYYKSRLSIKIIVKKIINILSRKHLEPDIYERKSQF